jgi:hypothetical protein
MLACVAALLRQSSDCKLEGKVIDCQTVNSDAQWETQKFRSNEMKALTSKSGIKEGPDIWFRSNLTGDGGGAFEKKLLCPPRLCRLVGSKGGFVEGDAHITKWLLCWRESAGLMKTYTMNLRLVYLMCVQWHSLAFEFKLQLPNCDHWQVENSSYTRSP